MGFCVQSRISITSPLIGWGVFTVSIAPSVIGWGVFRLFPRRLPIVIAIRVGAIMVAPIFPLFYLTPPFVTVDLNLSLLKELLLLVDVKCYSSV